MRLTSTGLGIGTSSPTQALTVNGQMLSLASSGASFKNITPTTGNNYMWLGNSGNNLYVGKESSAGGTLFVGSSAYAGVIGNDGAYSLQFATNNTVRATISADGNLGLGVTPNTWYSTFRAIQIGASGSSIFGRSENNSVAIGSNMYVSAAGSNTYIATNTASYYQQLNGTHAWYYAASGTAGTGITFTQAMTLDASGYLLLGRTSAESTVPARIQLSGSGNFTSTTVTRANTAGIYINDSSGTNNYGNGIWFDNGSLLAGIASSRVTTSNWGTDLRFYTHPDATSNAGETYERVRIDSSGNLLVGGTTVLQNAKITSYGAIAARNSGVDGTYQNAFVGQYDGNNNENNVIKTAVSSDGNGSGFRLEASNGGGSSGTTRVIDLLRSRTIFYTDGSEVARIDSSGNLLVGSSSTIGTGGKFQVTSSADTSIFKCTSSTTYAAIVSNVENTAARLMAFQYGSGGSPTNVGTITTNGTITVYGTTSDYRLKTVIGVLTGHGERIDALEPIEYTWNSNGSHTRGFLAHKFQEVYADSVTGEKDAVDAKGNPVYQQMQASTSEVIADLVAEIQSLRKRLAALEAK
jgi:hypothetical protein